MYILIPCLFIIFCCILQCKYLYSAAVQLWEETEADNRRLMSEMARVRGELKETKYQMENISSKVSTGTIGVNQTSRIFVDTST